MLPGFKITQPSNASFATLASNIPLKVKSDEHWGTPIVPYSEVRGQNGAATDKKSQPFLSPQLDVLMY
jgi:hypothetical protein